MGKALSPSFELLFTVERSTDEEQKDSLIARKSACEVLARNKS